MVVSCDDVVNEFHYYVWILNQSYTKIPKDLTFSMISLGEGSTVQGHFTFPETIPAIGTTVFAAAVWSYSGQQQRAA